MIEKLFRWVFAVIVTLALLPCILRMIIQTLGPFLLAAVIVALVLGAFHSRERTRSHVPKHRSGAASERTPLLPGGDR